MLPNHTGNIYAWPRYMYKLFEFKSDIIFIWPKYITIEVIIGSIFILLIMLAVITTPIGRFSKQKGYGNAKWATTSMIKKLGLNFKEGLLLGETDSKFIYMDKPLSVLLLAPAGSGKTSGIVIPNLLTIKNSVIVHDPKGEIYNKTSHAREKFSKVFLFDPISLDSSKYNVFAKSSLPKREEDLHAYVSNIASILYKKPKGDDFWVSQAITAFCFFAEWLIWKDDSTSFSEIRKTILSPHNLKLKIIEMIADEDLYSNPQIGEHLNLLGKSVLVNADNEKQFAGVIATLQQGLEIFSDSTVAQVTSGESDFSSEALRESSTSLYIKIRDIDKDRLAPLVSMIVDSIVRHLISDLPKKGDQRVTLFFDEFVRLGEIKSIIELPSISRGYNVNTFFIAQDYSQISKVYSKEDVEILQTNTAYKIVLRQNNMNTAEELSKLIGNETRVRTSSSKNKNTKDIMNASHGESKSKEGTPLISGQEINSLPNGEGLILAEGSYHTPIKMKLPYYFKHSKLKRMSNDA
jgi:type IV secretion system protein VirD4